MARCGPADDVRVARYYAGRTLLYAIIFGEAPRCRSEKIDASLLEQGDCFHGAMGRPIGRLVKLARRFVSAD
jgi:hypothetical protein